MSFSYELTYRKKNSLTKEKSISLYLTNTPGKPYKKGMILEESDLVNSLLFLDKGKVSIINQEHKDLCYQERFVNTGDFINLETAFSKDAYKGCYVLVETSNTTIKKVSLDKINSLLNDPSFNRIILQSLADQTRQNQKKANQLRFMSSRSRILQYLWDLANRKGKKVGFEVVIDFPPTQLEISIAAGTARQTATTNLLELRKNKIIHYNRRSLIFRDLDRLKQILDESR